MIGRCNKGTVFHCGILITDRDHNSVRSLQHLLCEPVLAGKQLHEITCSVNA